MPPKQLYADTIRSSHNLHQLLTIPVHSACNRLYQVDEDYFANTLAPFARGSVAGDAFLIEVFDKFAIGRNRSLVNKVIDEFDSRPSGIVLPNGLVAKRFEGDRLARIAWKIVRGLYFHHHNEVIPEDTPHGVRVIPPDQPPPEEFSLLPEGPTRGSYPGVFDYRFRAFDSPKLNYWALLLWDRVILLVTFHSAECACENCAALAPA